MTDAGPPEPAVRSLIDTVATSLLDLKQILGNTEDDSRAITALSAVGLLEDRFAKLSSRAFTMVKHAREQADADVKLAQQTLERREGEFMLAREHSAANLKMTLQTVERKSEESLKYAAEQRAGDKLLAKQKMDQLESQREKMHWEHVEALAKAAEQAKRDRDALNAIIDAKSAALRKLENKARADASAAKTMLETSESQHKVARCALETELSTQRAESDRQLQTIVQLGEERDAATKALGVEVERLRGLIRRFAGPAPSPSDLQAVHLEAFKKGPNPVVLRTARSAPSLGIGNKTDEPSQAEPEVPKAAAITARLTAQRSPFPEARHARGRGLPRTASESRMPPPGGRAVSWRDLRAPGK